MDYRDKVKQQADEFRKQSAERKAKLVGNAATNKDDRETTAAKNYLRKASDVLAARKAGAEKSSASKPSVTKKPAATKTPKAAPKSKTISATSKKEPFSVRHAKKFAVAKSVARFAFNPKAEIRRQTHKLYKKFLEDVQMITAKHFHSSWQTTKEDINMDSKSLHEISKKKKWMYAMDAHLEVDGLNKKSNLSKDEKRKLNNRVKGLSKVAHDLTDVPRPKLKKEDINMDDAEAIMNKFSPEELENMSPEQLRAAMVGKSESTTEEPTPEPEKTAQQDHAEKMPDNGPTPEGETAETVAARYAKALSGLNRKGVYSTFSGVKGGY